MAKVTGYTTIAGLNGALRKLPKEANVKLRDASVKIAAEIAAEAAGKARSVGGIAKHVAPSIRATRDRVPVIKMGGSQKLPADKRKRTGSRQTIGDVIWGAEYGSDTYRQFSPWRGSSTGAGYFLWPTVRDNNADIATEYSAALLDALEAI